MVSLLHARNRIDIFRDCMDWVITAAMGERVGNAGYRNGGAALSTSHEPVQGRGVI